MTINDSKICAIILDLDGTLLDTEIATRSVLRDFLESYGKVLITDKEHGRVGRTQKESAVAIVKNYQLPLTPDQFIAEITPLYRSMWKDAKALPGANLLLQYLHKHQIPFALASNSLREYIDAKISHQKGWKEWFSVILGSDQVQSGKPSPDLYLEAAKRMSVDPSNCLVIEDSLIGVKAAKAAGMKVVVVPSQSEADAAALADLSLHSLLDFKPELWDFLSPPPTVASRIVAAASRRRCLPLVVASALLSPPLLLPLAAASALLKPLAAARRNSIADRGGCGSRIRFRTKYAGDRGCGPRNRLRITAGDSISISSISSISISVRFL
ncbi:hypothetical protein SOVF_017390 isoform A [Spinacia oleracea]|nr:hypothetical protein SOVF_017390 isoform A [Spinacia oleracea]